MEPLNEKTRDQVKGIEFFKTYVNKKKQGFEKLEHWIAIGKTPIERIPKVKYNIGAQKLRRIVAKYSGGYDLLDIREDYFNLLHDYPKYWLSDPALSGGTSGSIGQYVDYDDMLWMISLAILFHATEKDIKILADLVDRDDIRDKMYEFMLSYKIEDRHFSGRESYKSGRALYPSTRKLVDTALSSAEQIQLLSNALNVDWKKDHKLLLSGLKGRHIVYYGAWSFETAAIVCILNLDDEELRKNKYYPSDLVDFYRDMKTSNKV